MIKYIGSKRALIPVLLRVFKAMSPPCTVVDLFSGTSRVGHALKGEGYRVVANDHNAYAATLARCYVEADREVVETRAKELVAEFNQVKGVPGYFTSTFCEKSRFFQPKNGARVDAIRDAIERKCLEPDLKAVLLTALMEAADRVDSTTGVQMAYLKSWAPRAHNDLELRVPDLLPRARAGKGESHCFDAVEAVGSLEGDILYLDPPYNQHKYLGNYHIWETLVLWDQPDFYGTACKRVDCRERGSLFNSKPRAEGALATVIKNTKAKHIVLSFNNEGYFSREDIERLLAGHGDVFVVERDFKRYVGAQIGIYNPQGAKVGEVSHLRNKEYIYVASPDRKLIARLQDAVRSEESAAGDSPSVASPGRADDVITMLRRCGSVSSGEVQQQLGLGAYTARTVLQALVRDGRAYSTGERRGRRYHPIEQPEAVAKPKKSTQPIGSQTHLFS